MEGWIKLHRKMVDWEWASSPNHLALFVHLLLRSNFKDSFWRGRKVMRGQLLSGRKQLSLWTGLSEQQIRTCLDGFAATKEVTIETTSNFSIITIINFELYQDINHPNNQQITNKQPTDNQQITTSKNANNIKNEKNERNNIAEKNLSKKNSKGKRKTLESSPLATLFPATDEIQDWLLTGTEAVQRELLEKFSHHVLAEEIKKAYFWQLEKQSRQAGTFLLTWMSNKKTTAYGLQPPKTEISELNPTGNPYRAQRLAKEGESA